MRWASGQKTQTMKGKKLDGQALDIRRESIKNTKPWEKSPNFGKELIVRVCLCCKKEYRIHVSREKTSKFCSKNCLGIANSSGRVHSLSAKKKMSDAQKERYLKNPRSNPFFGRTPTNYRGWGKGQYVDELGYWVRSTWEKEYLTALKNAGILFEYESERFDLGDSTYLPDVRLIGTNFYIEISGWEKPGKAEKRQKFRDMYDVDMVVITDRPTDISKENLISICRGVIKENDCSAS